MVQQNSQILSDLTWNDPAVVPDLIKVKWLSNSTDLAFEEDMSIALQELSDRWDSEARVLVKTAKILRQITLNTKCYFY